MEPLADELGVRRVVLESMQRELGPHDVRSVLEMWRALRRLRPDVVHTHGAKAGAVGRAAAVLARVPVVVHTFHGHVLSGYFSPRKSAAFQRIERALARRSDRLVAVSAQVRDDLVRFGVAPAAAIEVIRVGFDMARLDVAAARHAELRAAARAEVGIAADARVVAFVGRLVPIKRADRFLRAAVTLADVPQLRFLVVGDGEMGPELRASADAQALGERLVLAGYRDEVVPWYHAADLVVLTSDSEGTPVSLIEAAACGLPVVSTDVGGVRDVVVDGATGLIVPAADADALAAAIRALLADPARAAQFGAAGRVQVAERFSADAMARRHEALYRRLLADRAGRAHE